MDSSDLEQLLKMYWPIETDAVGPTYLRQITSGRTEFGQVHDAAHLDMLEILKILIQAATFINVALQVADRLRHQFGRRATPEELKLETANGSTRAPAISDEDLTKLLSRIAGQ